MRFCTCGESMSSDMSCESAPILLRVKHARIQTRTDRRASLSVDVDACMFARACVACEHRHGLALVGKCIRIRLVLDVTVLVHNLHTHTYIHT